MLKRILISAASLGIVCLLALVWRGTLQLPLLIPQPNRTFQTT